MKRLRRQWIGFFVILAGILVLAWPFLTGYFGEKEQKKTTDSLVETTSPDPDTRNFLDRALSYNEELVENHQEKLTSLESTETFPFQPSEYGLEDVLGIIWIPRMEVNLPLYLGADGEHMAKGAAVLGQTSVPMSTGSVNASIAGHRGYRGTPMFRDIQKMQIGDPIYIVMPWEVLVYRVSELRIVPQDDTGWCQIEEGKNQITLMTCHPYTQHTHRYIVFAQLSDEAVASREEILKEMEETYDPSSREVLEYGADGTARTVMVSPTSIEPGNSEYGALWSNLMILAEKQMKILLAVLIVAECAVGLWLGIKTGKEWKKRG